MLRCISDKDGETKRMFASVDIAYCAKGQLIDLMGQVEFVVMKRSHIVQMSTTHVKTVSRCDMKIPGNLCNIHLTLNQTTLRRKNAICTETIVEKQLSPSRADWQQTCSTTCV